MAAEFSFRTSKSRQLVDCWLIIMAACLTALFDQLSSGMINFAFRHMSAGETNLTGLSFKRAALEGFTLPRDICPRSHPKKKIRPTAGTPSIKVMAAVSQNASQRHESPLWADIQCF